MSKAPNTKFSTPKNGKVDCGAEAEREHRGEVEGAGGEEGKSWL